MLGPEAEAIIRHKFEVPIVNSTTHGGETIPETNHDLSGDKVEEHYALAGTAFGSEVDRLLESSSLSVDETAAVNGLRIVAANRGSSTATAQQSQAAA